MPANVTPRDTPQRKRTLDSADAEYARTIANFVILSRATQAEFAATMGVSRGSLSAILSGRRVPSRVMQMAALAAAQCLGVKVRL